MDEAMHSDLREIQKALICARNGLVMSGVSFNSQPAMELARALGIVERHVSKYSEFLGRTVSEPVAEERP
jgi:hypothetical protein